MRKVNGLLLLCLSESFFGFSSAFNFPSQSQTVGASRSGKKKDCGFKKINLSVNNKALQLGVKLN